VTLLSADCWLLAGFCHPKRKRRTFEKRHSTTLFDKTKKAQSITLCALSEP
jgi:hypothetical protein